MNLFDLYAKISLDSNEYTKGVNEAKKSANQLKSDVMTLAQTYKREGMTMSDAMKRAYSEIDRSQYETSNKTKQANSSISTSFSSAANDVDGSSTRIGKSISGIGDFFSTTKGKILAFTGVIGGAFVGFNSIIASTEEFRVAQGKVNTAFETAGYSAQTAQQAFSSFYGILGDTDTAAEASQLLAKLAVNQEDVSTWTDIAAGVWGTFGDALPIEGLIESANETAKVGVVTGSLADALNWAGISEDEFNQKLAACTTETERNQLIMDTLSTTYDEAADSFNKNNEAIITARENQMKLNEAMANVGGAFQTIKNAVLTELAPVLLTASEYFANFVESVDFGSIIDKVKTFVGIVVDLAPLIAGLVTAFLSLKTAFTVVTIAQNLLNIAMNANPILLIVTLIASLITALMTLWQTNETFRAAVTEIWEGIKLVFTSAWDGIKAVWDAVGPYFAAIWEGIKTVFSAVITFFSEKFSSAWNAITAVWDAAVSFFSGIWSGITAVFSAVTGFFSEKFSSAWNAVKNAWSGVKAFFKGKWDEITGVFSNALDKFGEIADNIVQGLWDGIQGAKDWLLGKIRGWCGSILNGIKAFFGIDSPSKVFRDLIGKNLALGMSVGIDAESDAALASLKDLGDELVDYASDMELDPLMTPSTQTIGFADSGLGIASAELINVGGSDTATPISENITIKLMLPDGTELAKYLLDPLIQYSRSKGTPIVNPI